MKARNIIADWPRGKSTESLARGWEYELMHYPWVRLTDQTRAYYEENAAYHREQQAMFDAYIERYRRPIKESRFQITHLREIKSWQRS
jgi:hypothetical protein